MKGHKLLTLALCDSKDNIANTFLACHSLSSFLSDPLSELKVDLKLGLKFLRGVCHGMAYLHSLEPLIPHMDVNSHHIFVSHTHILTGPLVPWYISLVFILHRLMKT